MPRSLKAHFWVGLNVQDGSHMSVRGVAHNGEGILQGFDRSTACQEDPKPLNDFQGKLGDIGEGGFDDFTIDAFGLANEPGGVGIIDHPPTVRPTVD